MKRILSKIRLIRILNSKARNRTYEEKLVKIYKNKSISVIDIGTGSGCILISILGELQGSLGVLLIYQEKL